MFSLELITDEERPNDARDVFISYLEAELNNLTPHKGVLILVPSSGIENNPP